METTHVTHPLAAAGIYAAEHRLIWGAYAARQYAINHNALHYYVKACQLAAATRAGF